MTAGPNRLKQCPTPHDSVLSNKISRKGEGREDICSYSVSLLRQPLAVLSGKLLNSCLPVGSSKLIYLFAHIHNFLLSVLNRHLTP